MKVIIFDKEIRLASLYWLEPIIVAYVSFQWIIPLLWSHGSDIAFACIFLNLALIYASFVDAKLRVGGKKSLLATIRR